MATNDLIAQLVDGLEPQAPIRSRNGLALVAAGLVLTILLVAGAAGLWWTGLAGGAAPEFYIVNAMLLVLGAGAASAAVTMASPRVDRRLDGPRWGMAMVAVLPVTAVVIAFAEGLGPSTIVDRHALPCAIFGTLGGLIVFAVLALWLRRGAPVSLESAGLYVGVAAGALGSFACGLACSNDTMVHLGLWHILPVVLAGLAGRLILPRYLRW